MKAGGPYRGPFIPPERRTYRVYINRRGEKDLIVATGLSLRLARERQVREQATLATEPGYESWSFSRALAGVELETPGDQADLFDGTGTSDADTK